MPLLNYTTSIPAFRTISEMQHKLAKAGASQVMHGYDSFGRVTQIAFRIHTKFGDISYLLPANIEAVEAVLKKQFPRRKPDLGQAERVGWRILKDWLEAQLALIETGMVTIEQVFLPYAQNAQGQTLYEALLEKKFTGLALPVE